MLQPELGVGKTNSSNEFLKMCKQLEFSFWVLKFLDGGGSYHNVRPQKIPKEICSAQFNFVK